MTGLSIDPVGDHFILRRDRADGENASISLTPEEMLTLAEMAPSLRQQALRMIYPQGTSSVQAIMAMDVFDFQLRPEVLEAKLLLMLRLGTTGSSSVAYAFSRTLVDRLAREISLHLPKLLEHPPTKQ